MLADNAGLLVILKPRNGIVVSSRTNESGQREQAHCRPTKVGVVKASALHLAQQPCLVHFHGIST
jgi:hypothetical protein